MSTASPSIRRRGVAASAAVLLVAAVLFVVYPALRPWGDLQVDGAAAAFASPAWVVAHLAAIAGFVLVGLGLGRYGRAPEAVWWIGAGLVLPYYGAEAFALHALGARMSDASVAGAAEAIRLGPYAATVFVTGLVALAAAGVVVAVREGPVALPFAAAMALFLPQFFAPPAVRIAHGALLGVALALLALSTPRRRRQAL